MRSGVVEGRETNIRAKAEAAAPPEAAKANAPSSALTRHRIPVIDRMLDVMFLMEKREIGVSIRELVDTLKLPRTSLYRILNTLEYRQIVRRNREGQYRLGPRLAALAAHVVPDIDLPAIAAPHLRRFANETGDACKLSIVDGDEVLVIAAADGKREYALSVSPGQRLPLHAGAASKVLMAHLPSSELERRLRASLPRFTPKTLTDRASLSAELAKVRRQGWAQDKGEYVLSVQAFGAPVADSSGRVVAALSSPFLSGSKPERVEATRLAVLAAAKAIAAELQSQHSRVGANGAAAKG
jgi:DNA-binding IclR family transcriptional regulator